VVLFIAGHGFNDGPSYRFLPTNAEVADGVLRRATVVPWYALQEAMEAAKGRRILFIDTCLRDCRGVRERREQRRLDASWAVRHSLSRLRGYLLA
jgi:hypothetical protein